MTNVASWGESLKKRREALGLSPDKLGPMAHVSGETIRRWERLDARPDRAGMVEQVLDRLEAENPRTLSVELEALRQEVQGLRELVRQMLESLPPAQ